MTSRKRVSAPTVTANGASKTRRTAAQREAKPSRQSVSVLPTSAEGCLTNKPTKRKGVEKSSVRRSQRSSDSAAHTSDVLSPSRKLALLMTRCAYVSQENDTVAMPEIQSGLAESGKRRGSRRTAVLPLDKVLQSSVGAEVKPKKRAAVKPKKQGDEGSKNLCASDELTSEISHTEKRTESLVSGSCNKLLDVATGSPATTRNASHRRSARVRKAVKYTSGDNSDASIDDDDSSVAFDLTGDSTESDDSFEVASDSEVQSSKISRHLTKSRCDLLPSSVKKRKVGKTNESTDSEPATKQERKRSVNSSCKNKSKKNMNHQAVGNETGESHTVRAGRASAKPGAHAKVKNDKSCEPSSSQKVEDCTDSIGSDSDDDWEEVEELPEMPLGEVQITVEAPNKKKGFDWTAYAKRMWKRFQKELHEQVHKVELLCLLVHGMAVNSVCNSSAFKLLALSVKAGSTFKGKVSDVSAVLEVVTRVNGWTDSINYVSPFVNAATLESDLINSLQEKSIAETYLILITLAVLRALGAAARLCVAWSPIPYRIAHYQRRCREQRFADGRNEDDLETHLAAKKPRVKKNKGSSSSSRESSDARPQKKGKKISTESDAGFQTYWLEVYITKEQKWVPLHCASATMDDCKLIESHIKKPITYIMSFDNDGKVKDLTQKYDPDWMTSTRKLRVESEWWEETLAPYHIKETKKSRQEDELIQNKLEQMPFPNTISGFKGHPLYALERHLLKFEGIYPPTAVPLGYTKTKEAIYSRSVIRALHSRETWLKEARQVKLGEEPYKYVKPRPKMREVMAKIKITEATLPVYGEWQTEPFVAPTAENGKVPRNAFGNVELFKPEMLPVGCVHIPIQGIGKLARKLDIDCAQAMIGWEAHSGYSCPQFDGWIVCKEHEQTLLDAWTEFEMEEKRKKDEKREKRIYGNWRTLIKGLLIRERLRHRYGANSF